MNRLGDSVVISGTVLDWFRSYLSNRSYSVCINQIMSDSTVLFCGEPQDFVLGPLLFLLYIHPLGQILDPFHNVSYHLYADDIQLYCSFKDSEFYKLSELLECLSAITSWLEDNFLQLNSEKTECLIIAPESMVPLISEKRGHLSSAVKSNLWNLGVVLDQSRSLKGHSKTLLNCFNHKLRRLVSKHELEIVLHAFISSYLDKCNTLFTYFNKIALDLLQLVQNSAARLLTGANRRAHITPMLMSLHWLPVNFRVHFRILTIAFNALHGQAPPYITELLKPYVPTRALRSTHQNLLEVPKTRYKSRGDRSFQTVAPRLWKDLPYPFVVSTVWTLLKNS
uniref:Reverse transcriptase domain-containing protein n=1 Tax=Nothobranchius furzeri TaxID=105023 RepID=A0A8C6P7H8_NOTFU